MTQERLRRLLDELDAANAAGRPISPETQRLLRRSFAALCERGIHTPDPRQPRCIHCRARLSDDGRQA